MAGGLLAREEQRQQAEAGGRAEQERGGQRGGMQQRERTGHDAHAQLEEQRAQQPARRRGGVALAVQVA